MWSAVPMATRSIARRARESLQVSCSLDEARHYVTDQMQRGDHGSSHWKVRHVFSGLAPANKPQRASAGLHAIADGLKRSG